MPFLMQVLRDGEGAPGEAGLVDLLEDGGHLGVLGQGLRLLLAGRR